MKELKLNAQNLSEYVKDLRCGDRVLLSGYVYTARDAAHKRITEAIGKNEKLPFEIKNAVIYYAGPTPAPKGLAVGSCGPTTSGRMDKYAPKLIEMGLIGMIGKGERSEEVCESIKKNGAVYFCAIGGAGALASRCIKECEVIAYEDLGCESVKKLLLKDFPLTVAIDCSGGNIFENAKKHYAD